MWSKQQQKIVFPYVKLTIEFYLEYSDRSN